MERTFETDDLSDEGHEQEEEENRPSHSVEGPYDESSDQDEGDEEYDDEEDVDDDEDYQDYEIREGNMNDDNHDDDDDDDDNVKKKSSDNPIILTGILTLNEEGRLVYSGTWQKSDNITVPVDRKQEKDIDGKNDCPAVDANDTEANKFKLKSKQSFSTTVTSNQSSNVLFFDCTNPLRVFANMNTTISSRSFLFDGFFYMTTSSDPAPTKIKEKDVEITFSANNYSESDTSFLVSGKGKNDLGSFTIRGKYTSTQKKEPLEPGVEQQNQYSLTCTKHYDDNQSRSMCNKDDSTSYHYHDMRRRKRGNSWEDDDVLSADDDDDFDNEGGMNDYDELIHLHEEATLSLEELKERYYGVGTNGIANKKHKRDPEDDDHIGCGF